MVLLAWAGSRVSLVSRALQTLLAGRKAASCFAVDFSAGVNGENPTVQSLRVSTFPTLRPICEAPRNLALRRLRWHVCRFQRSGQREGREGVGHTALYSKPTKDCRCKAEPALYAGAGPNTSTALRPPKAKEFDMA